MATAITTDLGVDALPGGIFIFYPKDEEILLVVPLEENKILDFQDPIKILEFI